MNEKPNWMIQKEKRESIPQKPAKQRKVRAPKNVLQKRAPKPLWTVVSKVYESESGKAKRVKRVISHLRFREKRVHSLMGATSKATLEAQAKDYNEKGYSPDLGQVRFLSEMGEEERLKLAREASPKLL